MRTDSIALSRADITRLLGAVLLTSTDLDHFICIHFPNVWQRISSGMERGQKEILLFENEDVSSIYQQLTAYDPERVQSNIGLITRRLDARSLTLRQQLTVLYSRKSAVEADILAIKHQLRSGAQISKGEYLGISRYRLMLIIGIGPIATVWLARDQQRERDVAVRILKPEFAQEDIRRKLFFEAGWRSVELRHDNIVRIIQEPIEEDGILYLVEEFMEIGDLERVISVRHFSQTERLHAISGICDALTYAHKHGRDYIHGDVKPSNILLNKIGGARINNFDGLPPPRRSLSGPAIDIHPIFSAPEILKGSKNLSPQSDIFSIAATTIFALVGRERFQELGGDLSACLDFLSCSEKLKHYLERAIMLSPADRPSSLDDLSEELLHYHAPIPLGPSSRINDEMSESDGQQAAFPVTALIKGE